MTETQRTPQDESKHNGTKFEALSPFDKVRAILSAVMEPVSQDFALELTGIDLEGLPEEEKSKIQSLFGQTMESSDEVVISSKDGTSLYIASDSTRTDMKNRVDMQSVHSKIADKLMGDLGLDF